MHFFYLFFSTNFNSNDNVRSWTIKLINYFGYVSLGLYMIPFIHSPNSFQQIIPLVYVYNYRLVYGLGLSVCTRTFDSRLKLDLQTHIYF